MTDTTMMAYDYANALNAGALREIADHCERAPRYEGMRATEYETFTAAATALRQILDMQDKFAIDLGKEDG